MEAEAIAEVLGVEVEAVTVGVVEVLVTLGVLVEAMILLATEHHLLLLLLLLVWMMVLMVVVVMMMAAAVT